MMEKPPIRIKHFANIGDIIASLAAIRGYYEKTKRKTIYSQQLNVRAEYYKDAIHPVLDDYGNNTQVMCNQKMLEMIRPLLLAQEYIADVESFTGQAINIDFDLIRKERFVNIPHQAIQQWLFMAYPDMSTDLTRAWLSVPEVDISDCYLIDPSLVTTPKKVEDLQDKVIINFTQRYRNGHINYFFLKQYSEKLIFAGTENEYLEFCRQWQLTIPRLVVKDFLQLAYIIKKSKFLFANQSFMWNVAEAMKTPRLLEICEFAPNCQPFIGEKSYGHLHQTGIKYYFEELIK